MRRRRFIQAIAATPAAPALLAEQTPQPAAGAQAPKILAGGVRDLVADPVANFFSPAQFAALRRLCEVLLPPMGGNPGAVDAHVPEFLDFLIGESPAPRQELYRGGLDLLNARAAKQFGKPFAGLDAKQADAIIRPLLVKVAWAYDPPKELGSHFVTAAHEDIRTASRNSREWADAAAAAGRRAAGAQLFWNEIDPIYKG